MNNKITVIARILFGLLLLRFGILNVYFMLSGIAPSASYSQPAEKFMNALQSTGYMMVVISVLYVIIGVCLLINRFVPLALILLTPITVNIVFFHLFLDIKSILPGLVFALLHVYLLFAYLKNYKPFMKAKNETWHS